MLLKKALDAGVKSGVLSQARSRFREAVFALQSHAQDAQLMMLVCVPCAHTEQGLIQGEGRGVRGAGKRKS